MIGSKTDGSHHYSENYILFYEMEWHNKFIFSTYHPVSYGNAGRVVHTFKKAVGRTIGESCLEEIIKKFLTTYGITSHTPTGKASCELLMGIKIRSKLDLLFPSDPIVKETRNNVRNQFKPGDTVLSKDFKKINNGWKKT